MNSYPPWMSLTIENVSTNDPDVKINITLLVKDVLNENQKAEIKLRELYGRLIASIARKYVAVLDEGDTGKGIESLTEKALAYLTKGIRFSTKDVYRTAPRLEIWFKQEPKSPLHRFIAATVRNYFIDLHRSKKRYVANHVDFDVETIAAFEPSLSREASLTLFRCLNECWSRLYPRDRDVLTLIAKKDLSQKDAAASLNASLDQFNNWVFRARQRLDKCLKHSCRDVYVAWGRVRND